MAIAEIGPRLRAILRYRAEKIVYVKTEPGVSWEQFLDLFDNVRPEVEIISLLTPQVDTLFRRRLCLAHAAIARASGDSVVTEPLPVVSPEAASCLPMLGRAVRERYFGVELRSSPRAFLISAIISSFT
jgi:hypothetical protein